MTDRQLKEIIIEELTDILTEGIFDDIKKSASDATSKLKDLFISKSDKGEELEEKKKTLKYGDELVDVYYKFRKIIDDLDLDLAEEKLIVFDKKNKVFYPYSREFSKDEKTSFAKVHKKHQDAFEQYKESKLKGINIDDLDDAFNEILNIMDDYFTDILEFQNQISDRYQTTPYPTGDTLFNEMDKLIDEFELNIDKYEDVLAASSSAKDIENERISLGFKKLEDGLTLDDIKSKYPWVLPAGDSTGRWAGAHKNAIVGLKGGEIEWRGGTYTGGWWKDGIFSSGHFEGSAWKGGTYAVDPAELVSGKSSWKWESRWDDKSSELFGNNNEYKNPQEMAKVMAKASEKKRQEMEDEWDYQMNVR